MISLVGILQGTGMAKAVEGNSGYPETKIPRTIQVPRRMAAKSDITPTRWFYGWFGVWVAQTFAFAPIAFMIMRGVVQGIAPSLEEAFLRLVGAGTGGRPDGSTPNPPPPGSDGAR